MPHRFREQLVDAFHVYFDTAWLAFAVYRKAHQGPVMHPHTQPHPNPVPDQFEQLTDSLAHSVQRYRNTVAQPVDRADARAELVALCDIIATTEHPDRAADRDPIPDGVADRVLNAVRDTVANHKPLFNRNEQSITEHDEQPDEQPHAVEEPVTEPVAVVDLVKALRGSIEAARARRAATNR